MKKFFAILVTMAILVSSVCIALPSSAADKTADYTVTADADYDAKKVSVTVEITRNPGLTMSMMDLTYNADVLTYASGAAGTVWSGADVTVWEVSAGTVAFMAFDNFDTVFTATGVVFTAEFDVKAGASDDATFDFALTYGENDVDNHFVYEGGDIVNVAINATVAGDKCMADVKPAAPNALQFSFTSEVKDGKYYVYGDIAENPGVWALLIEVDYNEKALANPTFTAGEVFTGHVVNPNVARVPVTILVESVGMYDITANGRAFVLAFDVVDCSEAHGIEAKITDMINIDGDDVVFETSESYASIEHKTPAGAAPDCTNSVNCELCGSVVIPALGHVEEPVLGTPADCTNSGLTDGVKCAVCLEWIVEQTVIDALGHTPAEAVKENVIGATCTTDGSYDEVVYCSVCNAELSREIKVEAALGHTPAEAVRENVVAPDCTTDGSYDEVVYCSVCGVELSRETKVDPATGHTAAEAVRENEVAPDCTTDGSYDEVVYCSVCGVEISRETKVDPATGHTEETIPGYSATCTDEGLTDGTKCSVCGEILVPQQVEPAKGHTPAAAVKENVIEADCTTAGSYDEVVYCDVCGNELSREAKIEAALGHTPAAAVKENVVAATCTTDGSYDEVVYCSVCNAELSREAKVEAALGHTPAAAVKENVIAATCTTDGSYDEVVYCDVCGDELSREAKVEAALGHTPAEAVKENVVAATCTTDGSYDEVVYCSVCGEEISRVAKVEAALGHTPAEAVKENVVEATCTTDGSYDEVVYCSVCNAELSREAKVDPAKGHTEEVIPAVDATCTETGLTEGKKCSVCGEVLVAQEEVPALGHLPEEELTLVPGYAATEDKEGLTDALVCDRCGETISGGEVIEKLPAKEEDKDEDKDDDKLPPQTGDNMTFIIIIAVVAAVACVVLIVYSKKRTSKASK